MAAASQLALKGEIERPPVWCALLKWMLLTFRLFLFKLTGGGRQQSRESCPLNITEHAGSCCVLHPARGGPAWMGKPWVVTVVMVYDIGTDPGCIFEGGETGGEQHCVNKHYSRTSGVIGNLYN